jgi:hypothetical protein
MTQQEIKRFVASARNWSPIVDGYYRLRWAIARISNPALLSFSGLKEMEDEMRRNAALPKADIRKHVFDPDWWRARS